jgi:hypothetical protein
VHVCHGRACWARSRPRILSGSIAMPVRDLSVRGPGPQVDRRGLGVRIGTGLN